MSPYNTVRMSMYNYNTPYLLELEEVGAGASCCDTCTSFIICIIFWSNLQCFALMAHRPCGLVGIVRM